MGEPANNREGGGGVLSGLRVLEIGHFVAAPFATRLLGDLGADVIKIEPKTGDPARQWGAQVDGHSLWWSMHARNKRCLALDLKSPRAKELILKLIASCDVLIENFRPGQLEKLGLGPDVLRQARPDLVIAHISGYGQSGPYRNRAAFGVIGEAIGGLRYLTDHAPETSSLPSVRVGVSIGDSVAGLYAVIGVLSALWQRDRKNGGDGQGRTLDVALTESILSLMEGMLPEYGGLGQIKQPTGGGIATAAPSNAYPTSDGTFVLIAANSEPLFVRLAGLMQRPDLAESDKFSDNQSRVRNSAELDDMIASWTGGFTCEELLEILNEADIPSCKVYTTADIASDPQYREHGMIREVEDPAFDLPVLQAGIVPQVIEQPGGVRWPGPMIGQHTDEVLAELAGMQSGELAELRAMGVIA